ncbi:PxKF domain-containing protein [Actinotalea sp. AC32]|nr:PxKF domain-containing protein [Actinotalea sp. AC32]
MRSVRRTSAVVATGAAMLLAASGAAHASSVDASVVDTTTSLTSVSLDPGDSAGIDIDLRVTGNQAGTATFEVYRDYDLVNGVFVGSNPIELTVAPRTAQDPATTFATTGTVEVGADEASGTFALTVGVFDITNTNATGAKLGAGTAGTMQVTVNEVVVVPVDTTPPTWDSPLVDLTATATANSAATVTYAPTATDDVDGAVPVTCTPASGSTFAVGATTVTCSASDAAGNVLTGSFTVTVSYAWNGFLRPIDDEPVRNVVKAGSSVPVKFSLSGNQGMSIFRAAPGSKAITASSSSTDVVEEIATAGASGLQYDVLTDTYTYVWKTDKAWAGTSRQLVIALADGSTRTASFNFTK